MLAKLTRAAFMNALMSPMISSSDGTQMHPPNMSVVRISSTLGSKAYGANCNTRESAPRRSRGARARAPVAKLLCCTPKILGVPVVPEVDRMYSKLSGVATLLPWTGVAAGASQEDAVSSETTIVRHGASGKASSWRGEQRMTCISASRAMLSRRARGYAGDSGAKAPPAFMTATILTIAH